MPFVTAPWWMLSSSSSSVQMVFTRKILTNPRDQEGENALCSPLPWQPCPGTHQRATCTGWVSLLRDSAQGEESHDPGWSTPIMNICWCLSVWEQMHFVLKYSHALILTQPCTQTPEARACAANMQLCGYDVIDFLRWLEAATASD